MKDNQGKKLQKLTKVFDRLGAADPESWARSEIEEGIPQLGRFVFLRALWDTVLRYPPESRELAIDVARELCYLLEGRPALIPPEIEDIDWGLFLRSEELPTQSLSGLIESFDDTRPDGHVWGEAITVVTLRDSTDSELERNLRGLDQLAALWLGGTAITDKGLLHLRRHPTLKVLDLSNTKITDAGIVELSQLPNLKALHLANTGVTDKALAEIGAFPKLDTINFENTAVTDHGIEHLVNCASLEFVLLSGTQATKIGISKLRKKFPEAVIRFDQ